MFQYVDGQSSSISSYTVDLCSSHGQSRHFNYLLHLQKTNMFFHESTLV